jgi:hypothetical protein
LGFDSIRKASAWLSINVSTVDDGLIVDPHTVFEHIFSEANGDDFLNNFERAHKLQILTLQQGVGRQGIKRKLNIVDSE